MIISFVLAVLVGIWIYITPLIELAITPDHRPVYSPSYLYENTNMNKFGCWFCFILIRLLSPVMTLMGVFIQIMYYICYFVEWLFTVGRKDD